MIRGTFILFLAALVPCSFVCSVELKILNRRSYSNGGPSRLLQILGRGYDRGISRYRYRRPVAQTAIGGGFPPSSMMYSSGIYDRSTGSPWDRNPYDLIEGLMGGQVVDETIDDVDQVEDENAGGNGRFGNMGFEPCDPLPHMFSTRRQPEDPIIVGSSFQSDNAEGPIMMRRSNDDPEIWDSPRVGSNYARAVSPYYEPLDPYVDRYDRIPGGMRGRDDLLPPSGGYNPRAGYRTRGYGGYSGMNQPWNPDMPETYDTGMQKNVNVNTNIVGRRSDTNANVNTIYRARRGQMMYADDNDGTVKQKGKGKRIALPR